MQGPAATATDFQRAQARSELHCRILATGGPGSGKTSLVVGRLERLISAGLPAESILSVLPTAEAAAAQRSVLAERCANRVVGTLRVASLADVAAGAVRRHWYRLGYPTEPARVTPTIRVAIVQELFLDGEDQGWGRAPEIARHLAFLRKVIGALETSDPEGSGLDSERFASFEGRYRETLRRNSTFDHSSAFANAVRLLIEGAEDTRTIDHVLADDADVYSTGAREYFCALSAGASSVVATASPARPHAVDSSALAAQLDCEPLVLAASGSDSVTAAAQKISSATPVLWSHHETSVEELEVMTRHVATLRRAGVEWDDVTILALDDGAVDRISDACRRARIPVRSSQPHMWVAHLDRLLAAACGDGDGAESAEALIAAVGSGLADLDPVTTGSALREALGAEDPVHHLTVVARSERGAARRLVPVIDCFQRAHKAVGEGKDVAAVAWMLWRGMPVAATLADLTASSTVDRDAILGARSVAAWHRSLRSAVAIDPLLTAQRWCSARRIEAESPAAGESLRDIVDSSVRVRGIDEPATPVGSHVMVPLLGTDILSLSHGDQARLNHAIALAGGSIRMLGSSVAELPPTAVVQGRPLVVDDEKLAESDTTVLLRAVGSATTPLDDQIVIAAALAEIDVDVPWATRGPSTGPVSSRISGARPALNGSALSRLNRCGLRFWFADMLGLADVSMSAEDRLGVEVRSALREWSEAGHPGDEDGLRSLLESRVVPAVRPLLAVPSLVGPLRARLAMIAAVVCQKISLPVGEPIATGVGVTGELFGVDIDLTIDLLLTHPGGLELLLWQVKDGLVDRLAGELDLSLAASKIAELFPQHEVAAGSVVDVLRGTAAELSLSPDTTKRILLEGATRLATSDFEPRRSAECARCPYRVLCPAHPEGRASW